jgi:hypothetical protein
MQAYWDQRLCLTEQGLIKLSRYVVSAEDYSSVPSRINAMAGPSLSVIIDDSRTDSFVFGPLEWTRTTLPEWFNSTSQSPTFALNPGGQLGTVQMKFDGEFFPLLQLKYGS